MSSCKVINFKSQPRKAEGDESADGTTDAPGQVLPLTETTNEAQSAAPGEEGATTDDAKNDALRPRKQRGPPEDGVASKTKVMVANLPYDLREEKVSFDQIRNAHICRH